MAGVPVIINNAMIVDYYDRVIGGPYKIVGVAGRSDLGIGGGPIMPPEGPPDEKPPVVPPPSVWPPGPGIDWPSHPIVIPPPVDPDKPPTIPPGTLITWTPVWTPNRGWFVVGVPNVPHPAPST